MKRDIAKLVSEGLYAEALSLYSQLHSRSFKPTKFTFPPLIKATVKLHAVPQAQTIHTHLIKIGFQADTYAATALTHMYMKFDISDSALKVFDDTSQPRIASLNATISGFSQNGTLTACEKAGEGVQLHCMAVKIGVEADIYVATSLMTMYFNIVDLGSATKVFRLIKLKSMVCFNAFITGQLQNGEPCKVLDVFKDMKGLKYNSITFVSVLSACSVLKYLKFGRQVHGFIVKTALHLDTMVGTALMDMYLKCGYWHWAYDLFKRHCRIDVE